MPDPTDIQCYLTSEERDETQRLLWGSVFGSFPANDARLSQLEAIALDRKATQMGVPSA